MKDITQADLLLPLAPRLTARSDTFRIRAYGEVRQEDDERVVAKAICEAIVQRVPEYYEADTLPEGTDSDDRTNEAWDKADALSLINQKLGRQFKVVSFRWLSPDEV